MATMIVMDPSTGQRCPVEAHLREDGEEAYVGLPGTGFGLFVRPDGSGEWVQPEYPPLPIVMVGGLCLTIAHMVGLRFPAGNAIARNIMKLEPKGFG